MRSGGDKNSCLEDFLLAKHTLHKHPHHDEPVSPPVAWFCWLSLPHPPAPLWKGLAKVDFKWFIVNSLTAIHSLASIILRASLVIGYFNDFVRCYCLIARKLGELFRFHHGIPLFYTACHFNELSRGSVLCLFNASFEKWFHNATTQSFMPNRLPWHPPGRYGVNTTRPMAASSGI